jgi:hypothetical protein
VVTAILIVVTDLERQASRVRNADIRRLLDDALRCYNAGAFRSSIAATWTAVSADIIDKIIELADGGDGDAQQFRATVDEARALGISSPDGVRAMQRIEDVLLDKAERFELIDSVGVRELNRIRQDRNLSVHPSLRPLGEPYDPPAEVARAHLATALVTVLVHPPTQGRRAITDFTTYLSDPYFTAADAHLQATYFDRLRTATRSNIVKVAAKHALCEPAPPEGTPVTASVLADRMAAAVKAFARRDRDLVRQVLHGVYSRFQLLAPGMQLRAVVRLGDEDVFWDMVQAPLAEQIDANLAALTYPSDPIPELLSLFSLVRNPLARTHLPILEKVYADLGTDRQAEIAAVHPDPYFLPVVSASMREADSFRGAERACEQVVLPHAPMMTLEVLAEVLDGWSTNSQCRTASRMPGLAVELYTRTAHLGTARHPAWQQFIAEVRARADQHDLPYYSYAEVEQALVDDGAAA